MQIHTQSRLRNPRTDEEQTGPKADVDSRCDHIDQHAADFTSDNNERDAILKKRQYTGDNRRKLCSP